MANKKQSQVLPNRMLVTDAVPVFVKEGQTKTFVLENLKNNTSKTATNVSNTLELTTNPIWEVIFALPSLKNDNNLSADVVFNKWFADVLASEIFKANPKLKTVLMNINQKVYSIQIWRKPRIETIIVRRNTLVFRC